MGVAWECGNALCPVGGEVRGLAVGVFGGQGMTRRCPPYLAPLPHAPQDRAPTPPRSKRVHVCRLKRVRRAGMRCEPTARCCGGCGGCLTYVACGRVGRFVGKGAATSTPLLCHAHTPCPAPPLSKHTHGNVLKRCVRPGTRCGGPVRCRGIRWCGACGARVSRKFKKSPKCRDVPHGCKQCALSTPLTPAPHKQHGYMPG